MLRLFMALFMHTSTHTKIKGLLGIVPIIFYFCENNKIENMFGKTRFAR